VAARLFGALTLAIAFVAAQGVLRAGETSSEDDARFFETQVRPILQAHCAKCHGGEKAKSGLRFTSRESVLKGGERGPAISIERPEESLLLEAINYGDLEMPPSGRLAQAQIDVLTQWVKRGAPWPESLAVLKAGGPPPVDDMARRFWSFRPVVRPPVPEVRNGNWVKTPIDALILSKLEARGLAPAPPARKTQLLRRLTYDLIGLPPTVREVDAFCADNTATAYEKAVDRLLASPHYGERWARHWLDLVRYAETNSFEFDAPKPNAWRYRDYVIKSLNEDKPYDRFIFEQLAGDELEPAAVESLIATGYYRLGPWDGGAPDRLQATYDELDDIVATTGQVFLGLTVNCARCHDHKIDPIPTRDYYRLLAFFHGVERYSPRSGLRPIDLPPDPDQRKDEVAARQRRLAIVIERLKATEDGLVSHLDAGERDDFKEEQNRADIISKHVPTHVTQEDYEAYRSLIRERAQLERAAPQTAARALCVTERGATPPETFVFIRGNPRTQGEQVEPGFLSVLTTELPTLPEARSDAKTSGRRSILARWIASAQNPLTARVIANRVWQYHFGRGIVRTSSDFGYRGSPPTHPELLDWLASEFTSGGWSLKRLHKLIVMSSAYQMSSQGDASAQSADPENDLFWRFDPRRLEAEEIRDSVLAVCGNIRLAKLFGPSIRPPIQRAVLKTQSRPGNGWDESPPDEQARRSVYIHIKRSLIMPMLAIFDGADTDSSCPVRFTTTQPTQALGMLNGEFLNEQARIFAADLREKACDDPAEVVRLALKRVVQREPSAVEVERGVTFLARLRREHSLEPQEALAAFCLLALNLNEFVYLE
jgi:mono/diheme cytochrome c family protein